MEQKLLKDLCIDIFPGPAIFNNDALSNEDAGGYRVIRLADIENGEISYDQCHFYNNTSDFSKNRYILKKGDILLSSRGTIFKVAVVREDIEMMIPSGYLTCVRLSPKIEISADYVASYIQSLKPFEIAPDLNEQKHGVAFRIRAVDIFNINIPIADAEVQKKIEKLIRERLGSMKEIDKKKKEVKKIISTIKTAI